MFNFNGKSELSDNTKSDNSSHEFPNCKSPKRMQKHLDKLPPVPFEEQLTKASDWVRDKLTYDQKILCVGHELPARLQDGPQ